MTHFQLYNPTGYRVDAQLRVDGHDIAKAVTGVNIRLDAGENAMSVVLDLKPDAYNIIGEEAAISVAAGLAPLLEQLGWTPPTRTTEAADADDRTP